MNLDFEISAPSHGTAVFLERTQELLKQRGYGNEVVNTAKNMLSLESISQNSVEAQELQRSASELFSSFRGFATEAFADTLDAHGKPVYISKQQLKAATIAGMMGGDLRSALNAPTTHSVIATEGLAVSNAPDAGVFFRRAATEAYDESSTSTSVAFSISYNLACARQDEFGETLYPTTVIPPDQAGLMMSVDLALLQKDAKHAVTGAITNFRRYNVIRAQTYPELLQGDATDVVPVFRDENKDKFVDATVLAPRDHPFDDETSVSTSYLKIGKKINIIGISQTDALIEHGLMTISDQIDPGVQLDSILVKMTDGTNTEVFSFATKGLPYATFNQSTQDNYKKIVLQFENNSLLVNKDTKQANGDVSALLAPVRAGVGYEVRMGVNIAGSMNIEKGDTLVQGTATGVQAMYSNGNPVSFTTGAGKAIADLFETAEIIGYTLQAKRTNLNRRQRGQLITTTTERQFYSLNLLAPVTVLRPLSSGDVNDARDVSALIFTTQTRSSNAAVDNLLETAALLKSMQGETHLHGETQETFGLARHLLDPYYKHVTYSAPAVVDSTKSSERQADIRSSLVSLIMNEVYRMFQISAYQPAAASQNGGIAQPPTVIIATDQYIAQYLSVVGDLRTLGIIFPLKVVHTTNIRMRGKLFVTFGNMETAAAGIPNVLHWGTCQYRPEMTVILPISREGQTSKEITVSPSFRHHVNLPLLVEFDISGIDDTVAAKLPINFHEVV